MCILQIEFPMKEEKSQEALLAFSRAVVDIMQIIQRMIQHVRIRLNELHHLPQRLDRQHRLVPKGIDLQSAHKRHLLQPDLAVAVEGRFAVGAEGDHGEHGTVAQAPALLFGVDVAGFEDLLGEALEVVFVEIVPLGFELGVSGAAADEWACCRWPAVEIYGDEVTQLFAGALFDTSIPFQSIVG